MNVKLLKKICWFLTPIILILLIVYYGIEKIPNTVFLREGEEYKGNYFFKVTDKNTEKDIHVLNLNMDGQSDNSIITKEAISEVSLFGVIPVKDINIKSISKEIMLYPGGQPIGVKLNTKGVLVISLSDIETENGKITSPASASGIQIGDSIIKANNVSINSSEELAKAINSSEGKEISLIIIRKGKEIEKKVQPIKNNADNSYKIGLWIRDSTAGVGTLTFYDSKTKRFAALGHPITDVDTGTILSVNSGQIVNSTIVSVRKGERGNPGELKGIFVNEDKKLGDINKNTECGIFGNANNSLITNSYNKSLKIGLRNEIKEGPAKILTTIDGEKPKLYDIEIQKLLSQESPGPKSMIIKVTDNELLEKTGGIVQGMSGSPIIQDDKLIGAVTHVLINKPDTGYGIYIEWMIKDADILAN